MAEGKTLGVPGVTCEFCEEADAIKFCIECNQPMCGQCTKIHGKVASSKTHNFIPIEDYKLFTTSKTADTSKAYCAKHQQKIIDKLCEDCLVVVCSECESEHKDHKLNSGSFNANFLHRVCAQKVPGLLEIIQELKDLEDGSPAKIRLYKEAEKLVKSWKDQLLDLINKDADRLLGEIRDEIKKHEQILADSASKTKEYIVKADHQITKMSESRKISNSAKLLDQMSKCDKDIEDIKSYIEGVKVSQAKQTINDILPYKDGFQQALRTLKNLFTKIDVYPGIAMSATGIPRRLTREDYNNLRLCKESSLPRSVTGDYRLGGTYVQRLNQIMVFEFPGNNIHIFDRSLGNTKTVITNVKILKLLMINVNRYVIVDYINGNVCLTNENFEVLNIIAKPDSGYEPYGLCSIFVDQCIVLEVNGAGNAIRLREIKVSGNSASSKILCKKIVGKNFNGLISTHASGRATLAVSDAKLCTVNLKTGEMETVHTIQNDTYTSICGDGENVLVGTFGGYVYKVSPGEKSSVFLQGLERVNGLQVTDSEVVVLSGSKLQIYKPQ